MTSRSKPRLKKSKHSQQIWLRYCVLSLVSFKILFCMKTRTFLCVLAIVWSVLTDVCKWRWASAIRKLNIMLPKAAYWVFITSKKQFFWQNNFSCHERCKINYKKRRNVIGIGITKWLIIFHFGLFQLISKRHHLYCINKTFSEKIATTMDKTKDNT